MRSIHQDLSVRMAFVIFLALIYPFIQGCSKDPSARESSGDASPQAIDSAGEGNSHVAGHEVVGVEINGTLITQEEILRIAEPYFAEIDQRAAQQTPAVIQNQKQDVFAKVVRKVVLEELLRQEAEREGIVVSNEEVDEKIESLAHSMEPPLRVEEYIAEAKAGGKTLAQLREEARRGVAIDKLMDKALAGKAEVSDADVRSYYDSNPDEFVIPENVLVSHILIQPEPGGDDPNTARAAARRSIELLAGQIEQGADFAELARTHSTCQSRSRGGSLGYVKEGELSPAFDEVAFALRENEVSDIVEASYGFHLIKVFERHQEDVLAFADVRDKIREDLRKAKRLAAMQAYMVGLEEAADIRNYSAESPGVR